MTARARAAEIETAVNRLAAAIPAGASDVVVVMAALAIAADRMLRHDVTRTAFAAIAGVAFDTEVERPFARRAENDNDDGVSPTCLRPPRRPARRTLPSRPAQP